MPLTFQPVQVNPKLQSLGIHSNDYRADFVSISNDLIYYKKIGNDDEFNKIVRQTAKNDFFFFCYFVLDLPVNDPFLIARIYEVQDKHDGTLDLWAREHWKSSVLTFALSIWLLAMNPRERICIFSHTRSIAKSFLRRIKFALETNDILKGAFPDIFYANPKKDAPKWSEDEGLYVIRTGSFNEASIEAWGLVDGMPTSKHYTFRIYDDLVTEKAVSTPDQVRKVTDCIRLSENLGARKGRKIFIGTRYSNKDPYDELMKGKKLIVRTYPAEIDDDGRAKIGGLPVFMTREELDSKLEDMGEYIYSAQMLQSPSARSFQQFKYEFLRWWSSPDQVPRTLNKIIIVDPARKVGVEYDYSVIQVWGLSARREYWLLDMVRDKITVGDRWEYIHKFGEKYGVIDVAYETTGNTDMDYIRERMEATGVYFNIIELTGTTPKISRISNLHPIFKTGRFIFPKTIIFDDALGNTRNLIFEYIYEEYVHFPYSKHDDMLDCTAWLISKKVPNIFPSVYDEARDRKDKNSFNPFEDDEEHGTWMSN